MTMTTTTEYCDSNEAAAAIGITPYRLRLWRHKQTAGQPKFLLLPNGRIRYRRSDLDAFIKSRTKSY